MGELESPTVGTDIDNAQWHVAITLDTSGPMSGFPINPFTIDNLFDTFDEAVERATAIREHPYVEVDYPLEDDESVNVKITPYDG